MKISAVKAVLPKLSSVGLAFLSALLLVLAFPDFEFWYLACFALIPLFFAIESEKESFVKSFITGWVFGTIFFMGSCWWLTYAPIHYGGVPAPIAYLLILAATSMVGLFPALFSGLLSLSLKRFETWGVLAAPFLWTAIEFLRFWLSGNNWNAIAYSQAFSTLFLPFASIGGIYLIGFWLVLINAAITKGFHDRISNKNINIPTWILLLSVMCLPFSSRMFNKEIPLKPESNTNVIGLQVSVPMGGMKYQEYYRFRDRHIELAEGELKRLFAQDPNARNQHNIVIFPESPMNFGYTNDEEFQQFLGDFTKRNNVKVIFNAAEPTGKKGFYNSAIMVNEDGKKIAQYDKIYLVPFGEFVPILPESMSQFIPVVAGNFEKGQEYDIIPLGDVKAGIMICYESHFPILSRRFVNDGADVILEMTNDGYLGPTGVLRQHLASAVFRAVETNRPLLRVTNVGITAYINENGEVIDPAKSYSQATRTWQVSKSDGSLTFYMKFGDWMAWLCIIVSFGILFVGFWKNRLK